MTSDQHTHRPGCPHWPVSEPLGSRQCEPHDPNGWGISADVDRSAGNDRYTNPGR